MKRPLGLFAISMCLGIITAHLTHSFIFIFIPAILYVLFGLMVLSKDSTSIIISAFVLFFYFSGAFLYTYESTNVLNKFQKYLGKTVYVEGMICSDPALKPDRVSYILRTNEISHEGVKIKVEGKIQLSTPNDERLPLYKYGQKVSIEGELILPKGQRNPGGFNYKQYLAQSGISATIFAKQDCITNLGFGRINWAVKIGRFLRDRIVNTINKSLPQEQAGLLNGMLIGYREGLTDNIQEDFSKSGLTHIMAVSGANVAFITLPFLFILKKLKIKKAIANSITIAVLILFVFITGVEPSVLRAAIMGIIMLMGQILNRETDFFTSIAFAALILLLWNPFNLFNIGFQLSFIATLSIVLFFNNIHNVIKNRFLPEGISTVIGATLAAQLGVLPISIYYFNTLSVISLLSNCLVVPLTGLITVLGMLMALLGQVLTVFSQLLGYINLCLLSFVLIVVKLSAKLPYSTILVKTPSLWQIILYYFLLLFFLWYKPLKRVKLNASLYAAGIIGLSFSLLLPMVIPKPLQLTFIDVGQGDSAYIMTSSGKSILIDGGDKKAEDTPLSFLLYSGVTKLDAIIASHGHDDHIRGLIPVLENLKVEMLMIPDTGGEEFKDLLEIVYRKNIKLIKLARNDIIKLDPFTEIYVFNPIKGNSLGNSYLNNTSLVLKLNYKDVSILFTGDAEEEIEKQLLQNDYILKADILKVGHHGSDTSTSKSFLEKIDPKAVIISVGKNNFNHPSDSVLERLEDMEIKVFRTDTSGAIVIKTYGERLEISKTLN